MTARIWRAGDAPLAPGTRFRALVVHDVSAAVGTLGSISEDDDWAEGAPVDFDEPSRMDIANFVSNEWYVAELEVIEDGGDQ